MTDEEKNLIKNLIFSIEDWLDSSSIGWNSKSDDFKKKVRLVNHCLNIIKDLL